MKNNGSRGAQLAKRTYHGDTFRNAYFYKLGEALEPLVNRYEEECDASGIVAVRQAIVNFRERLRDGDVDLGPKG